MITVQYIEARNVLCVSGIAAPFPPASLVALRQGDQLAVASPHDGTLVCGWADFGLWTDGAGNPLPDADTAFAYLTAACAREPPQRQTYPVEIVSAGQIAIPLPTNPRVPTTLVLTVNGVDYRTPTVAIANQVLTWANPDFPLVPGDEVTLSYL